MILDSYVKGNKTEGRHHSLVLFKDGLNKQSQ